MQPGRTKEARRLHVLLVDDDPSFRSFVKDGLLESGIDCTVVPGAPEALAQVNEQGAEAFDVVLIDIMMPGMSGWDLLEQIHANNPETRVIFVTAREAIEERVKGLRLGADDYVIKPFVFSELLARIDAVVRRRQRTSMQFGRLSIDLLRRRALVDTRYLALSPREFDLLRVLVQNAPQVVPRQALLEEVWQVQNDPGTNVIEVHVVRLRRKLSVAQGPTIRTVRGCGYAVAEGKPDED